MFHELDAAVGQSMEEAGGPPDGGNEHSCATGLVLRPAMRQPQAAGPSARWRGSYRVNGRRKLALRSGQAVASAASRTWSTTAESSIA